MSSNNTWSDRTSLEAAAEAAAKVNAMLIAKGKLKPSQLTQVQGNKNKSGTPNNLVVAEVEINNAPLSCRNLLTRGSTQEEISRMSGASVSTRGRYMTPEDRGRNVGERALYLCIQGPSQDSVNLAVGKVNEIIVNTRSTGGKVSRFSPITRGPPPSITRPRFPAATPQPLMSVTAQPQLPFVQEKLYIGLEHAPPSFDVKNKLLGVGASFLQHIQAETGAKVSLRGKGSGFIEPLSGREAFEPMHVHLQHGTLLGLQQAKQLAENLIQTVQQEYAQFQQALAAMPPGLAPGLPTLLTGIAPQSPAGAVLGPPPPGITTVTVSQSPPFQAATTLIQPVTSLPLPGMFTAPPPHSTGFINPPPGSGAPVLSAPGVVIPTSLGTSLASVPISMSPGIMSNQLDGVGGAIMPNINVPPPVLQPISQTLSPAPGPVQQVLQPPPDPQIIAGAPVSQPGPVLVSQIPGQPGQMMTMVQQPVVTASIATYTVPAPAPTPIFAQVNQPLAPGMPQQAALQPVSAPNPAPVSGVQMSWGAPTPVQPSQMMATPPVAAPMTSDRNLQQSSNGVLMSTPSSSNFLTTMASGSSTVTSAASNYLYSMPPREEPKRRFTEEKQEEKLPENLLGYEHGPPHLTNLVVQGPPPTQQAPPTSGSLSGEVVHQQGPGPQHQGIISSQDGQRHHEVQVLVSGAGMTPPPVSPGVSQSPPSNGSTGDGRDKILMPPPPPPGIGIKRAGVAVASPDQRKKVKTGYGGEEEEEEEVPSSMSSQVKEVKKYSYNQYSSTPQLYSSQSPGQQATPYTDQYITSSPPTSHPYTEQYTVQGQLRTLSPGAPGGGEPYPAQPAHFAPQPETPQGAQGQPVPQPPPLSEAQHHQSMQHNFSQPSQIIYSVANHQTVSSYPGSSAPVPTPVYSQFSQHLPQAQPPQFSTLPPEQPSFAQPQTIVQVSQPQYLQQPPPPPPQLIGHMPPLEHLPHGPPDVPPPPGPPPPEAGAPQPHYAPTYPAQAYIGQRNTPPPPVSGSLALQPPPPPHPSNLPFWMPPPT